MKLVSYIQTLIQKEVHGGGKHMIRHFRAECPRIKREKGGIQVCCVSSVQISIKENTAEACEETGIAKQ